MVSHADLLRSRVGGFFRNTYGVDVDGICGVCRGPASAGASMCRQCRDQHDELDGLTCDDTIVFTYAQANLPEKHQSVHTVGAYKWSRPVQQCVQDMRLTVRIGTEIHGECIFDHIGHRWDSATYVPSSHGRKGRHPVADLAVSVAQVADRKTGARRFLIEAPDTPEARALADSRVSSVERFAVPDASRPAVEGRHVLLVDDTWTSGASIQSAAAAIKAAGAASVTGLVVDRWLSAHYADHEKLMKTLTRQYDPMVCPMGGSVCA